MNSHRHSWLQAGSVGQPGGVATASLATMAQPLSVIGGSLTILGLSQIRARGEPRLPTRAQVSLIITTFHASAPVMIMVDMYRYVVTEPEPSE